MTDSKQRQSMNHRVMILDRNIHINMMVLNEFCQGALNSLLTWDNGYTKKTQKNYRNNIQYLFKVLI